MYQFVFGTNGAARIVNLGIAILPTLLFYLLGSENIALAYLTFSVGLLIPTANARKTDVFPLLVNRRDPAPPVPVSPDDRGTHVS